MCSRQLLVGPASSGAGAAATGESLHWNWPSQADAQAGARRQTVQRRAFKYRAPRPLSSHHHTSVSQACEPVRRTS